MTHSDCNQTSELLTVSTLRYSQIVPCGLFGFLFVVKFITYHIIVHILIVTFDYFILL